MKYLKHYKLTGFWNIPNGSISNERLSSIIPIISKEEAIYYITEYDMIKFIEINSDQILNTTIRDANSWIRDVGISDEEGKTFWEKKDLNEDWIDNDANTVLNAWFKSHPFMERFMIVFDA